MATEKENYLNQSISTPFTGGPTRYEMYLDNGRNINDSGHQADDGDGWSESSSTRCIQGDDEFVSCLNEASKKKAKDELGERNDEDRKTAVRTLRQWVLQQDWLTTPTDFEFLLRFLRIRKFSQLGARQTLENYWTNRTRRRDFHADIDPNEPMLQEIFRKKLYYSPMKYDKDGCRWFYSISGTQTTADLNRWGMRNILRAVVLFVEWVCMDENVQVNGIKWFFDYTDLSLAVVTKYTNMEDQKALNQLIQKAAPMRLKAAYFYNEPSFFDIIYNLFAMFTKQKMLERVHVIGKNMAKMYEKIEDKSILPREYLPDDYDGSHAGTESEIIEAMIADMTSPKFREHIKNITSSKYGVDENKLKQRAKDDEPASSFRKLNVD